MPHFDPVAGLKTLVAYPQIRYVSGVPTMYNDMLHTINTTGMDLGDSNRKLYGFTGGSIVPLPLRRAYEQKFPNFEFLVVYGTTENSPTSFMTTSDSPKKVKEETCGFVLPHTGTVIDIWFDTKDKCLMNHK